MCSPDGSHDMETTQKITRRPYVARFYMVSAIAKRAGTVLSLMCLFVCLSRCLLQRYNMFVVVATLRENGCMKLLE